MDFIVGVARGSRLRVCQTTLNLVFCVACLLLFYMFNKLVSEFLPSQQSSFFFLIGNSTILLKNSFKLCISMHKRAFIRLQQKNHRIKQK